MKPDLRFYPKPLHVQVAEALATHPLELELSRGPHNVGSIAEDGNFPLSKDTEFVWMIVHHLPPDHEDECVHIHPYIEDGDEDYSEPCHHAKTWRTSVPRPDLDWRVGGPLIERLDLCVEPTYAGLGPGEEERWTAAVGTREEREGTEYARGPTPLVAVCLLILLLHSTGELKRLL